MESLKFRCHCAYLPAPPPSLALLGVCYRRSMHLAKSIRVFRAFALYRYSLPLLPSISSSLSHFSLTLRGLLITSLISLSGFLWGAIWPRWYVHEGVRLRAITGTCVCLLVRARPCLAVVPDRCYTWVSDTAVATEVESRTIPRLNLTNAFTTQLLSKPEGEDFSVFIYF